MNFSVEELQFLNKHLDYTSALRLSKWLKYNAPIYRNLSDSDAKITVSNAILRDEETFDPNKGALVPYLKHSIQMALIGASTHIRNLPKHFIANELASKASPNEWIDLSYFSDSEIRILHTALVNNCVNFNKVKELLDGYSNQVTKRSET